MRIRWRGLELPSRMQLDEQSSTDTYGRFVVEPFERGFGTTVGNSLRRILLSSLEGAAVFAVKITNASHEFTTIPGVLEDVADILLQVKQLVVQMESDEVQVLKIAHQGAGEVTAAEIAPPTGVEVINRDLKLATLTEDVSFEMELRCKKGRGYATAEENAGAEQELGVIPVDSIFSPVTRVRYKTEDTRVGQRTNYDRLVLEVWTRGSVSPEDAVVEAGKILRKHLNPFVQYYDLGEELVTETVSFGQSSQADAELRAKLARSVNDLELSVRSSNCLESARIQTLGELVAKTEADLLRVRSFGKTSLREVKRKLSELGLSLGINLDVPSAASSGSAVEGSALVAADGDDASSGGESFSKDDDSEDAKDGSRQSGSVSMIADSGGFEQ